MAYSIPPSWAVNQTVPLAKLSTFSSDLTFLGTPPCGLAVVQSGSPEPIASGAGFTQIGSLYFGQVFVAGSMVFTSSDFVVPVAGRYYVSAAVGYSAAIAGGTYQVQIQQNGTALATGVKHGIGGGDPLVSEVRYLLVCAASDTVSLWTSQNSGSSENATARMFIKWISN